jgi:antitoxin component YwqK of YwqJK toxin-antitoxin module
MKLSILTLLLFCVLGHTSLFAQVDSTQINGKYYKIYPIRQRMEIQEEYWIAVDDAAYFQDEENYFNVFGEGKFFNREAFDSASVMEKVWMYDDLEFRWKSLTKKQSGFRGKFAKAVRKNPEAMLDPNFSMSSDLLPSFTALPDGDYVQLYNDFCLVGKNGECQPQTDRVAVFFRMENDLLNGPATWVNTAGDTLRTGTYKNGLRTGTWGFTNISNSSYYFYKWEAKRFAKTGSRYMDTALHTITYNAGERNGPYSWTTPNGSSLTTGFYSNGIESGNWKTYEKRTLVRNITYAEPEATQISHKPILRTSAQLIDYFNWREDLTFFNAKYQRLTVPNDLIEYDFGNKEKLELEEEEFQSYELENDIYIEDEILYNYDEYGLPYREYPERVAKRMGVNLPGFSSVSNGLFDLIYDPNREMTETRGFFIDSLGVKMQYDGLYELYYQNGQLFLRYNFVDGELQKEDTLFWDNGQAWDVIEFVPDSNYYLRKIYDYNGTLTNTAIYDSLGDFMRYDVEEEEYEMDEINIDGITASKDFLGINDFDYYSYSPQRGSRYGKLTKIFDGNYTYRNPIVSTDSIVPDTAFAMFKEYNGFDKKSLLRSITFNPETRTYNQDNHSYTGVNYSASERVYTENYNGWTGKSTWKYGKFTVIETASGIWREDPLERDKDTSIRMSRIMYPYYGYYVTTDVEILKDGIPYTGEVVMKNKSLFPRISKNKLVARQKVSTNKRKMSNHLYRYLKKGKKHPILDLISGPSELEYVSSMIAYNLFQTANASWFSAYSNANALYGNGTIRPDKVKGQYLEGKPQGYWSGKIDGDLSGDIQFERGEAFGTHRQYGIEYRSNKLQRLLSEDTLAKRKTRYLNATTEYQNGMRNGEMVDYTWYGSIESKGTFEDDFEEGEFVERQRQAYSITQYQNGYLDGYAQTYLTFPEMDTVLLYDLNFQDGGLSGESNTYHINGKLAKRGFFLNGEPIEDYEAFDTLGFKYHYVKFQYGFPIEEKIWEENQLSLRYKFDWKDSIQFDPSDLMQSQSLDRLLSDYGYNDFELQQEYYGRNRLVNKNYLKYHMTKYYPNDTIARAGLVDDAKKIGLWKFYDYDGQYLYKVNYFDSIIHVNDSIRFKSKGILTKFNASGDSTYSAHIIEKMEKYDCAHTDHYEIRQLYTVWEANQSVGRMNGFVQNFYDNGVLQNEGELKDGLPTGLWKYYDPFGKLNLMGSFEQGKRQGRWLKGDLEKKKYLGELSLNPNIPNLEKQKKYRAKK